MESKPKPKPIVTHRTGLTLLELKIKTSWIRDSLEPFIARNGPEPLSPDTVLELASFFTQLLAQSRLGTASSPILATVLTPNARPAPLITLDDIKASRIHRALLIITGRGTRWPGKLIEICDMLVEDWTQRFGDLNMIRPLLYEKGGSLYEVRAEREMSRHALLVKWLSDHSTLVSPLRALETGHLEFRPGRWWIHPIFAFHDGIIDSPDPRGGITADGDGAYAITMTGHDEIENVTPEKFTYCARKHDKGVHKLLRAFLPRKLPIRILRSHTLHSTWAPVAGLRYDGLYKISSYSVSSDKNGMLSFELKMQRDTEQTSLREVMKHPTAEEIDDYMEYKRLRQRRSNKMRDSAKRSGKAEQVLGVMKPLQDASDPLAQEPDPGVLIRRRRADFWDPQEEMPDNARNEGPAPLYDDSDEEKPKETVSGSMLDGVVDGGPLLPTCSNPSAHEFRNPRGNDAKGSPKKLQKRREPIGPLRDCCDDVAGSESEFSQMNEAKVRNDSAFNFTGDHASVLYVFEGTQTQDAAVSLNHVMLRSLRENVNSLTEVTKQRGGISNEFLEDLKGMLGIVNQWEMDNIAKEGYVDRCIWEAAEAISELRHCHDDEWNSSWVAKRREQMASCANAEALRIETDFLNTGDDPSELSETRTNPLEQD